MVIQRWQSLLLFISMVLVAIFSVSDYASIVVDDKMTIILNASENIGYWILNILTAVMLLLSIFLFKKPSKQKLTVILSSLLMIASAIWGLLYIKIGASDCESYRFGLSWILLFAAFVMTVVAYFCIVADQKLLKSYDRIR